MHHSWAQVEWWLEHRHGWLIEHQWAGSVLGWVTHDEYQVLGSTSIPARLDTLVYWESLSWLTSVGTTRNTVIMLGWSRIGLAVLIIYAAGAGLIGAVVKMPSYSCMGAMLWHPYGLWRVCLCRNLWSPSLIPARINVLLPKRHNLKPFP